MGFSFDPDASDAPPKAYFKHGSATLTIGTQVIKLDKMVGEGFLSDQFGARRLVERRRLVRPGVWHQPAGSEYGEDALVSFDHIVNGQHWTVGDPSLCRITVTRALTKRGSPARRRARIFGGRISWRPTRARPAPCTSRTSPPSMRS